MTGATTSGIPVHVVDAFTDRPFAGNPAAVVVLDAFPDDAWLGAVAAEMNLSETAFVVPAGDGEHELRWFTPAVEVDLCGHATLAAASVVGLPATFRTRSGVLRCVEGADGVVRMDFPALPPSPVAHDGSLARVLGVTELYTVARSRFDLLVELADAAAVRAVRPDLAGLTALGARGARGCIVTAPGDRAGIDVVSRFFAPGVGVPEDPVTGSAHCVLGPFWGERLDRRSLVCEQASARGGIVHVELDGDRVWLGGRTTAVWSGVLHAAASPATPQSSSR